MKRNRRSSNIRDRRDTAEQIAQEAIEEEEFQQRMRRLMETGEESPDDATRLDQLAGKEQDTINRRHMKSRRRMHEQRIEEPLQGDDALAKLGQDSYNGLRDMLYDYYQRQGGVPIPRPRPKGY